MARLLTVVNERKKLRNEYRAHLEDKYIWQQQKKDPNSTFNMEKKMKQAKSLERKQFIKAL